MSEGFVVRFAALRYVSVGAVVLGLVSPVAPSATATIGEEPGQPLFRIEGRKLIEASGIVVGPDNDLFYVNQDAGNTDDVFVLDLTGRPRAIVRLPVKNEDWEDIAPGPAARGRATLYLADTGDAYFTRKAAGRAPRTRYAIVRLDRPPVGRPGTTVVLPATGVLRYPFVFADKATHNAESLLVDPVDGRVFVADKTENDRRAAYLWMGPAQMSAFRTNVFEKVGQIPVAHASGGAFSPERDRVVIRNSDTAYIWFVKDGDIEAALTRRPVIVPLPPQRQGEGVSFTPNGRALVLASEGAGSLVWQVDLPPEAQAAGTSNKPDPVGVPRALQAEDRKLDHKAMAVAGVSLAGLGLMLLGRWSRRRHL